MIGQVHINTENQNQKSRIAAIIDPMAWTYDLTSGQLALKPRGMSDEQYRMTRWSNFADRRLASLQRAEKILEALLANPKEGAGVPAKSTAGLEAPDMSDTA